MITTQNTKVVLRHLTSDFGYACYLKMLRSDPTIEDQKEVTSKIREHLRWARTSGTRYHFVFDCSGVSGLPLSLIYEVLQLLRQKRATLVEYLVSTAVIVPNEALRVMMNAGLSMYTPVRPVRFFMSSLASFPSDADEARAEALLQSDVLQFLNDMARASRPSRRSAEASRDAVPA